MTDLTCKDTKPTVLTATSIADHDAASVIPGEITPPQPQRHVSNEATVAPSEYQTRVLPIAEDSRHDLTPIADFSTGKRDPILPCHFMQIGKNKDFYGREDVIRKIEDVLLPADANGESPKNMKIFSICGPGGMGKTQIATEFTLRYQDAFEAIFWVHADEEVTLADEFSQIAEKLGLVLEGTADAKDPVVTRELAKGWLAEPLRSYRMADRNADNEVPWLLVFDNVDNPDLIWDYLPPMGGEGPSAGSVLITSRDSLARTPHYQVTHGIDLAPLSQEDAANLLLKLTWREDNDQDQELSSSVADILGGLPLALTQMAGVMNKLSLSFDDFIKRYEERESHKELFSEPSKRHATYKFNLATVWALEELEHSRGLLDVMSLLHPDGISNSYLEGSVDISELQDYPKTVRAYQDARSELLRSSLVNYNKSTSKLTIHRLIQDCAKSKMSLERSASVFSAAVNMLWLKWPMAEPGVRHHIARWKECELMCPHILRLRDYYTQASEGLQAVLINNLVFAQLMNELGW